RGQHGDVEQALYHWRQKPFREERKSQAVLILRQIRQRGAGIQAGGCGEKIEGRPAQYRDEDSVPCYCGRARGVAPLVESRVNERPEGDEEPDEDVGRVL